MVDAQGESPTDALAEIFAEIVNIKQNAKISPDELSQALNAANLRIELLREFHRSICEDTDALKDTTADAKAHLDQSSLQLESLLYERSHYEKEIRACAAFRSAYTDEQLELLSTEEYIAFGIGTSSTPAPATDAPTPTPAVATPMTTDGGDAPTQTHKDNEIKEEEQQEEETEEKEEKVVEHQRTIDRLNHELTFRKATLRDLEALKAKRDGIAAAMAQRRTTLAGLDADIARLHTTALKIQKQYS